MKWRASEEDTHHKASEHSMIIELQKPSHSLEGAVGLSDYHHVDCSAQRCLVHSAVPFVRDKKAV